MLTLKLLIALECATTLSVQCPSAMGGSRSEEFLAPCPTGEDTYVLCEKCGYAANVEAMKTVVVAVDFQVSLK